MPSNKKRDVHGGGFKGKGGVKRQRDSGEKYNSARSDDTGSKKRSQKKAKKSDSEISFIDVESSGEDKPSGLGRMNSSDSVINLCGPSKNVVKKPPTATGKASSYGKKADEKQAKEKIETSGPKKMGRGQRPKPPVNYGFGGDLDQSDHEKSDDKDSDNSSDDETTDDDKSSDEDSDGARKAGSDEGTDSEGGSDSDVESLAELGLAAGSKIPTTNTMIKVTKNKWYELQVYNSIVACECSLFVSILAPTFVRH